MNVFFSIDFNHRTEAANLNLYENMHNIQIK